MMNTVRVGRSTGNGGAVGPTMVQLAAAVVR